MKVVVSWIVMLALGLMIVGVMSHSHHHHSNVYMNKAQRHMVEEAPRKHSCIHDELMREEKLSRNGIFHQMETARRFQEEERKRSKTRTVQKEVWGNLRVGFRTDYLGPGKDVESRTCAAKDDWYWDGSATPSNTPGIPGCAQSTSVNCWKRCLDVDVATPDFIDEILTKLIPQVRAEFYNMAQVRKVQDGDLKTAFKIPTRCGPRGGVPIPSDLKATGFDGTNADVIMFVTARPTSTGVLGWATSCLTTSPTNRPVAGHLNLSPQLIAESFAEKIGVTKHESLHALGFSEIFFGGFYDANTTSLFNEESVRVLQEKTFVDSEQQEQIITISKLITPTVLEVARKYYNCPTLDGVRLEEGGGDGTAGSHWEKNIMYNELMVGSVGGELVLSSFTLAFLEDSGWYKANFSHAGRLLWGRSMGCEMADGRCENWSKANKNRVGYYCTQNNAPSCSFDLKFKGSCALGTYSSNLGYYEHVPKSPKLGGPDNLMDYCPGFSRFKNGDCSYTGYTDSQKYDFESFGSQSACFSSSLLSVFTSSDDESSRCLSYTCAGGVLSFFVGGNQYTCPRDQSYVRKTDMPTMFKGYVDCPERGYDILCKSSDQDFSFYGGVHNSKGPCFLGVFFCGNSNTLFEFSFLSSVKAIIAFYASLMVLLE